MNEPAGFLGDDFTNVLKQYYYDTYNIIRKTVGDDMGVMLSDGFRGLDVGAPPDSIFEPWAQPTPQYWKGDYTAPQYQGTSMDIVRRPYVRFQNHR